MDGRPINLATYVAHTQSEGPGTRFAIWTQGCAVRCKNCCNPGFFAHQTAERWMPEALFAKVLEAKVKHPEIEGVSVLGGEPAEQPSAVAAFARLCRDAGLSVMTYTSWELDELRRTNSPLLEVTDLLKTGRYVEELRTTAIRWIGSTNQRFHFLTDRYRPDDPRFLEPNTTEIALKKDGTLQIVGFPFSAVLKAFPGNGDLGPKRGRSSP